jgi:hypothetical protein
VTFDYLGARDAIWGASDEVLKPMDRYVALALLSYWSLSSPEPYPSLSELQTRTGMARDTVNQAIKRLCEQGAIVKNKRTSPGGLPYNSYDLAGILRLPQRPKTKRKQFNISTSSRAEPVQLLVATSSAPEPELVQLLNSKKTTKKTNKKTRSPKPPTGDTTPMNETDARIRPVVEFYASTFEREFRRKPATNYPRAAKLIKLKPPHVSTTDLQSAIEVQLTQRRHDQFAGKDAQHVELHEIVGLMGRILAWSLRKPQQGPATHSDEPVTTTTGPWRRAK